MVFLKFIMYLLLGYVFVRYAKWITDNTQRLDFAERWFGATGTYTLYKLICVLIMFYGFYVLVH